jgi:hypothetical protein
LFYRTALALITFSKIAVISGFIGKIQYNVDAIGSRFAKPRFRNHTNFVFRRTRGWHGFASWFQTLLCCVNHTDNSAALTRWDRRMSPVTNWYSDFRRRRIDRRQLTAEMLFKRTGFLQKLLVSKYIFHKAKIPFGSNFRYKIKKPIVWKKI